MTLHASELGGAAPAILLVHIAAGSVCVLSGAAALAFGKGSGPHRAAGTVFFLSMLTMSGTAAYLAVLIQEVSLFAALLAIYLAATGWAAITRNDGAKGNFEVGALIFIVGVAAAELIMGLQAAASPTGRFMNTPPGSFFAVATIATLAAAMDLKVIVRGVSGAARIARHLWRMCFAMFIALFSFMVQGLRTVLPTSAPGFRYVLLLALVPLVLMIYWLIRVRLTNWAATAPCDPGATLVLDER